MPLSNTILFVYDIVTKFSFLTSASVYGVICRRNGSQNLMSECVFRNHESVVMKYYFQNNFKCC